jgi:hypothetical protein
MEPSGSERALKGVGNGRIRRAAATGFAEHLGPALAWATPRRCCCHRACQEAKHRVRSPIVSAELEWSSRRITINLARAGLRKERTGFDVRSRSRFSQRRTGVPRLQPVAISGKSAERRSPENKRNPLPPAATGCLRRSMVRVHPHQEREGVTSLAPQEAPSPANPRAHRT